MKGLLIFLSIFAVAAFLVFLIYTLICWYDAKNGCRAKIKYKSFKKFYNLNPDRWILRDGWVDCFCDYSNSYSFYFSYFDWFKYEHFAESIEKHKEKQKANECTAKMLAAVKQDIERHDKVYAAKTQSSIDDMQHIINSLRMK